MNPGTFAIVHGAGDVGSTWDLVAAELRQRSHDVVAVDLPCDDDTAGLADYADTVAAAIGGRERVIVVAHSLGGFSAPLVCDRVPVEMIVLVTAMIPEPGETAGDWWANTGHATDPRGDESEIALFCHDAPPDAAAAAIAAGRDQSATPMDEAWPLPAWPDVPTRFLLCSEDRFFPPDFARAMVKDRLGIVPDEIEASHCPYLSRPAELAQRLDAYAKEIA